MAIRQADIRKEELLVDLKEDGRISSDTRKTLQKKLYQLLYSAD
jgi:hypothetical protein